MGTHYRDYLGNLYDFQNEEDDESPPPAPGAPPKFRAIVGLTTAMRAQLTAIVAGVTSVVAGVTSVVAAIVDERFQVSVQTIIETRLQTLAESITANRMAVNVDSTTTGKLDTLHADLNPSATDCDQVSSTNASAQLPSHVCTIGAVVKNISTGSQKTNIKPGATATSSNGWELAVGEEKFFPCRNTDELRHYSTASGAQLCFQWV